MRLDCDSEEHKGYEALASIGIILFPIGVPVIFLYLLVSVCNMGEHTGVGVGAGNSHFSKPFFANPHIVFWLAMLKCASWATCAEVRQKVWASHQVWHKVPEISYYKDLREVVSQCIREVALHRPSVMAFVKSTPDDELFERIPIDVLQTVVSKTF